MKFKKLKMEKLEVNPAPSFSVNSVTGVALSTIYSSHYARMAAVIDATRTGNRLLISMALEYHDQHGSKDVKRDGV